MRNLLTSLIISFALVATASPSFAGNDHEDKKWERDKKVKQYLDMPSGKLFKKLITIVETLEERVGDLEVCLPSAPTRFVDNGDGTICDNQTGLMWEKKLAADGADGGNCADTSQANRDVHCVNNIYTWTDTGDGDNTNPDGTLFTVFLATLNQEVTDDDDSVCFASHCDWRVPRLVELRSIRTSPCLALPCIDPTFGPVHTGTAFDMSSTSEGTNQGFMWMVGFDEGAVGTGNKSALFGVRAVRSGR